jgi:hypothetical protein
MATDLMVDWVKIVWERRFGALRNTPCMLVAESFHGHMSEELTVQLERKNCCLVVIPFGMISQLQSINDSVNKSFKHYLRNHYEARLLSENFHYHKLARSRGHLLQNVQNGSRPLGRRS